MTGQVMTRRYRWSSVSCMAGNENHDVGPLFGPGTVDRLAALLDGAGGLTEEVVRADFSEWRSWHSAVTRCWHATRRCEPTGRFREVHGDPRGAGRAHAPFPAPCGRARRHAHGGRPGPSPRTGPFLVCGAECDSPGPGLARGAHTRSRGCAIRGPGMIGVIARSTVGPGCALTTRPSGACTGQRLTW